MTLTQQPFVSLLEDLVDQLEWQRMERLDKRPQFHDVAACDFCGRPFKAYGSQTQCRRRDCIHALETPEQRADRARIQELNELVKLQAEEIEHDKLSKLKVTVYDPVRKQSTEQWSVTKAFHLDAPLTMPGRARSGGSTDVVERRDSVVGAGIQRHMTEWYDPVFDQAEPEIERWLGLRTLRRRVSSAGFGQADPGPDQLVVGFSEGRRFANRKAVVPAATDTTRAKAPRKVYNPNPARK